MLAAHLRIRTSQDFRTVLRSPARAATPTMVVHVAGPAPWRGRPARAGFVVGRGIGGAVTRNRVARRLRHLMAAHLAELPEGLGVVVRALPPAATASSTQLERDLASALRRARARADLGQQARTHAEVSQ